MEAIGGIAVAVIWLVVVLVLIAWGYTR